jgi:hypothetical protein
MTNDTSNPKLFEMTEAAIKILQKNPKGYLLLVEGNYCDILQWNPAVRAFMVSIFAACYNIENATQNSVAVLHVVACCKY